MIVDIIQGKMNMAEQNNLNPEAESDCKKNDSKSLKTIHIDFRTGRFSIDVSENRLNVVGDVKEYIRSLKGTGIKQQKLYLRIAN